MAEQLKERIKGLIETLGKYKLLLGIIQVGMVLLLPMTIVILVGCPYIMPELSLRIRAFFGRDIEWNIDEYPWSIFNFGELKFVDNLQLVVVLWVIGIVSLLVKEIFKSQKLLAKLITIQGQILFIGYGAGTILGQFLLSYVNNEMCMAAIFPPSNPYKVFTIYYLIAALIGVIIIYSEWKELEEMNKKQDLENRQGTMSVLSAIKLANFFGIVWILITHYRFLEEYLEILRSTTSLPFTDEPYKTVNFVFSLFLLVNLMFTRYFGNRAIGISSKVYTYLIYFLFAILGWGILLENINTFTDNYNIFNPGGSLSRVLIVFIPILTLIWFSPALIYRVRKWLNRKEEKSTMKNSSSTYLKKDNLNKFK